MPHRFLRRSILALLSLAALSAQDKSAKTTSPEQRAKFVQIVQSLEKNPLGPGAKEQRSEAMLWLIQAPGITVKLCGNLLQPLMETQKNHATEIFAQMTLASGAFVIENPAKAKDDVAVYIAGVEGALRVYEVIRRVKPKEK